MRNRDQFSTSQIKKWAAQKVILKGHSGGLVVGNSHLHDGIVLIGGAYGDDQHFEVTGEMEGFEFVLCKAAYDKYADRIKKINSEMRAIMSSTDSLHDLWQDLFRRNENIVVVNAILDYPVDGFPYASKAIWLQDGQFIINKYSSLVHYEELLAINNECRDD
jgi:hypothetical protein